MELVTEEILLGPAVISHGRIFPKGTEMNVLIADDDVVYLDLTEDAMFYSPDVRITVAEGIEAIKRTLSYNFRSLDEVIVTINGNVPFEPAYRER